MAQRRRSFWDELFGTSRRSERQARVLKYVIRRIRDGVHPREVLQEEYVRRNATRDEIRGLLEHPRLVEAAGEQLRKYFSSGELDLRQRGA